MVKVCTVTNIPPYHLSRKPPCRGPAVCNHTKCLTGTMPPAHRLQASAVAMLPFLLTPHILFDKASCLAVAVRDKPMKPCKITRLIGHGCVECSLHHAQSCCQPVTICTAYEPYNLVFLLGMHVAIIAVASELVACSTTLSDP